jgi:hypothetical protein
MSMNTAQNRLKQATKELTIHWDAARASWDDTMSRRFHESHLAHLEPMIRTTVAAMEKMSELLAKARQECGP